jgi:hypothetical protein
LARDSDLKRVRKTSDPVLRKGLLTAMKSGMRYRMLENGIMLYADNGKSATFHFTPSDHRAARNATAQLRSLGVDLPTKKGKR